MMTEAEDQSRSWTRLRRGPVLGAIAALMVLPVVALRLANPAPADPGDFMFLAILFGGIVAAFEIAVRVPARFAYAFGIGFALAAGLLSAWINLAVGIIGSEDNPANLIYAAVLAIALIGALLSGFRPRGMARAMVVTAIAQALTLFGALVAGFGFTGPITVFFVALWLLSAQLFARAAEADSLF